MTLETPSHLESQPSHGPTGAAERQEAIEREERLANILRFIRMLLFALPLYISFVFVDWMVSPIAEPGWLTRVWLTRLVFSLFAGSIALWLHRKPLMSKRMFSIIDAVLFTFGTATVSYMCIGYGGFESPYAPGVILIMIVRGVVWSQRWTTGIIYVGLPGATYPMVLLTAALFSPELSAQLHDRTALIVFSLNNIFIASATFLLVLYGHIVWVLRRQVFESRSIGRYRLRRLIGRGGMGEVWAAYHRALERDVAVKILRLKHGRNEEAVARFNREVRATSLLSHPNTVRVFDYGVTYDGLWYYAMELLRGKDLRALVAEEGALEPARALHFASQTARALAEAHGRGIVHRDIKPENLFIAQAGGEADFVKVLDFGIAKIEVVDVPTLTRTGWVGGTPTYMSPEVAKGSPAIPASDVYGLGATLYYALTGRPPFQGDTMSELILAQLKSAPPPPSSFVAEVPEDIDRVVLKCLQQNPENRFEDAARLSMALDACELAGTWRPALQGVSTENLKHTSSVTHATTLHDPDEADSGDEGTT